MYRLRLLRKNKANAFTMIELIVVMLLTSILVTVLWSSFDVLKRFFIEGQRKNERAEQVMFFHNQLADDFVNCNHVKRTLNDVVCIFKDREVSYRLNSTTVIRKQHQHTDTLKVDNLSYSYTSLNLKHAEIIEGLQLSFRMDKRVLKFLIRKQYDAAFQLQVDIQ